MVLEKSTSGYKQLNFFDKVDGKDLVITLEVTVPYVEYEGYEISINNLNHDYFENVLWWFQNDGKVVGVEFK